MRARSSAASDAPFWETARPADPTRSRATSDNRFMAQNIHVAELMADD
jgi:hypothetical protein